MSTRSLAEQWTELATAALLGTDRRPGPPPPPGEVAALVAAAAPADDAERVLVQVAALAAARRGGVRPGPACAPIAPCPPDPRPSCPPAAARRLAELLDVWPDLVDEWLDAVVAAGYRLAPETAVALLARFRTDAARRPHIEAAAGPIVGWLAELFPGQFAPRRAAPPAGPPSAAVPPAAVAPAAVAPGPAAPAPAAPAGAVPLLPLPAEFEALLAAPTAEVARELAEGLAGGRLGTRHRPVLVHVVRRLPPRSLPAVADALGRAATNAATLGLAMSLADLAHTRHAMLAELAPPDAPAPPDHVDPPDEPRSTP